MLTEFNDIFNQVEEESLQPALVLQPLIDAVSNEEFSPEILSFKDEILTPIRELVEKRVYLLVKKQIFLEDFQIKSPQDSFILFVYQQELERIKFLVRSYLRTRIRKVVFLC
jgi:GINS complex subunit 4